MWCIVERGGFCPNCGAPIELEDNKGVVKTSGDWYWGKYFIIDENQVVLGKHLEGLRVYDYFLEGNLFVLDERTFVRQ